MGIETYLTFAFWVGVIAIILRCLIIAMATYPRGTRTTLGSDLISLMVSIACLVWVVCLRSGVL